MKTIQEQLDKQIHFKRAAQVVEASAAPRLSAEVFTADTRPEALVEVNFAQETARFVDSSDAPLLTPDILSVLGKPIKTVEMFFENNIYTVQIRDGKPLSLEVAYLKLLMAYEDIDVDAKTENERDRAIANLLLAHMVVDPAFSYQDKGDGTPIESLSSVMIEALCNAYAAVNTPEEDAIYQVKVRRGVPADVFALFGESFEWYPVGGENKRYVDMSEEERVAAEARHNARRQVLVSQMIVDPLLSFKANTETDTFSSDAYPVENLSERFLNTLYEAHRVVNIPEAGLKSLQRFLSAGNTAPNRTETGSEPLEE